jgi:FemAB-related protein (PEP-CTERM system-associated)
MSAEPLVAKPAARPPLAVVSPILAPEPLTVETLTPPFEARWDRFVRATPGATFFHLLGWRFLVERTFRHRAHYLLARRGERIVGVLPMFELKSRLFGHSLVSVPFAIGGGVVREDEEAARLLLDQARTLAEALRVDYLELRSERPVSGELLTKDLYVTFRADLTTGEEAMLKKMDRKRRQMMNYVARAGFESRVVGIEELPRFYALFCESMRHHGTPVYPQLFLQEILDRHPGDTNLFFVYHEGRLVSGVLNLMWGDVIMPYYAGSVQENRPRGVDDYMYLAVMRWGREHGFRTFDFGRSKRGTGAHAFKARWGMDEVPLAYQYHLVGARELPNVSPANPKYKAMIRAWQKLPLPLTRLIGPRIIRSIP